MLLSFKIADLINIALEDGSYFRSKTWYEKHKGKLLVEQDQQGWVKKFFDAVYRLKILEKSDRFSGPTAKKHFEHFEPIVEFFKTLEN